MTNYKSVPVEPTEDMLEAGHYAMVDGCCPSSVYADMLAAAPAVQGEPVAWRYRMLSEDWEKIATIHPSTFHPDHKDLIIEPLYTAPQPAEQQPVYQHCEYCDGTGDVHSIDGEWRGVCDCQQPTPGVVVLSNEDHVSIPRGLIAAACSAIDKKRDADNVLSELRRYTLGDLSRQTELDVSALVETLERAHMALIGYLPSHRNDITDAAISHCEQALAAHRKGGQP